MTAPIELSRPVRVDHLQGDGLTVRIDASPDECKALAGRLDLLEISQLDADITLSLDEVTGLVLAQGRVQAHLVQSCVVTLEPVPASLAFDVERWYGDGAPPELEAEVVVDAEAPDPPDPIVDGFVDLGEMVSEELALAIDPYPRAAAPDPAALSIGMDGEADGPFGKLAALRSRRD